MATQTVEKEGIEIEQTWADLPNTAAPGAPYYTPMQSPPSGTALDPDNAPALFKPLKIRGLTLQNRIFVSTVYKSTDQCLFITRSHHYVNILRMMDM